MAQLVSGESSGERSSFRLAPLLIGAVSALAALAFLPGGIDQFWLPKMLVLLCGVPLTAAAALLARNSWFPPTGPGRVLVALAMGATLWSIAVPLAAARNPDLHRVGGIECALLAGLFLIASCRPRPADGFLRSTLVLPSVAAVAVALIALLQAIGLDPVWWLLHLQSARPGRWRILTTIGNPGWTAEFLAVSLPLVLAGLVERKGRTLRLGALGLSALLVAAVVVTGSRTGIAALLTGLVTFTLAVRPGRWRLRITAAGVVLAATLALAALFTAATGSSRWSDLRPLTGRAALWSAGSRLLTDRPVTGFGLRHTGLILPQGLRREVADTGPAARRWLPTTLVDRLDGDWLQLAVERGLPAAGMIFLLWAGALVRSWRIATRHRSTLDAGIFGSLTALGTCTLTSAPLHTPATAVLFWLLTGLAAGGTSPRDPDPAPSVIGRRRAVGAGVAITLAIAAGAVFLAATRINLEAGRGHRLLSEGRAEAAVGPLRSAASALPWLDSVSTDLAEALEQSGRPAAALAACADSLRWKATERAWGVQVRALCRLGQPPGAQEVLNMWNATLPASPLLAATRSDLSECFDLTQDSGLLAR